METEGLAAALSWTAMRAWLTSQGLPFLRCFLSLVAQNMLWVGLYNLVEYGASRAQPRLCCAHGPLALRSQARPPSEVIRGKRSA